jgi:RNA polymerase sigma-70 factor (ECF subfamily)
MSLPNKLNTDDERELLEKLRSGNHAAFEEIYHIYKVRLIANSLRLLKSPELAEELVQDLFLKIWEQRHRIDTSQSLNAYLYKVANNMAYDTFRKISRDKRLYDHLVLATESTYDHIEKYIFSKENMEELNKAIHLLPPQQQKVFTLCKLEDKSYEEASLILNITIGTINNHMYRANLFLKQYFSERTGSGIAITVLMSAILEGIS